LNWYNSHAVAFEQLARGAEGEDVIPIGKSKIQRPIWLWIAK